MCAVVASKVTHKRPADHVADVAVLGNGPAGAAACAALGRLGVRPVWVLPGNAAPPALGETLSVAGIDLMRRLDAGHLLEAPGHRPENVMFSAWGTGQLIERHAIRHPLGAGKVLDRARFNESLGALAASHARALHTPCTGFSAGAGGWQLMLADGGQVRARFVIDATGRRAFLGRRLGVLRRLDSLVAVTATLAGVPRHIEPTPATLIESASSGWWYATLLPGRRVSLMYFTDADLLPFRVRHAPEKLLALLAETRHVSRWLDDLALDAPKALSLHACGTAWLVSPASVSCNTPGWAAVGDAALALDPLSSHGISSALWAAHRVAEGVVQWLDGRHDDLAGYVEAIQHGRQRYLEERRSMYGREKRFPDAIFWRRRGFSLPECELKHAETTNG